MLKHYKISFASLLLLLSTLVFALPDIDLIELKHKPPAPEFVLPDMQNKAHSLSDYIGQPVIVTFWATWCPPCIKELPSFNRASAKLKDENISILGINVGEDRDTITSFQLEHDVDFTILLDEEAEELENWNPRGLPTTYIVNAEGKIVYKATGEREWDNDSIINKVRALKNSNKKTTLTKK